MGAPVRTLIISGDPATEEAVLAQLQAVGQVAVVFQASNESDYVRLLKVGVDVVLALQCPDGRPHALQTRRALALLGERALDVPFIIVTASIGEEAVVEYMRQGATDVIFADRLSRLEPAISRALADREARFAQRRAESARTYSETRFRTISALISDFAYSLRVVDGGLMAWEWMTEMTGRIAGLHLDDLPDQGGWLELAHPEDRDTVQRHYARLCADTSNDDAPLTSEVEFRIVTRTGEIHYLRDHCQAVWDEWGRLIFGAVKDITPFREAGLALRASEQRFRQLFEHAADAVFVNDRDGRFLDANQLAVDTLGYSREELQHLSTHDINPALTPEKMAVLWQIIADGGPQSFEGELFRKDGTSLDIDVRLSVLESGGEELMLAVVRNISERKRAEQALRDSEERYRRIVETSAEGILVSDAAGRISFANERLLQIFGYERAEVLGRPVLDFITPEARPLVENKMAAGCLEHRQEYDVKVQRKDGSDIWIVVSASALLGSDGQFQERLAMVTDVTARRRAEEVLLQAQKLESVGRLAAGIAHEINTPIQFVGDNVHFLRDSFASLELVIQSARALRDSVETDDRATSQRAVAEAFRSAEDDADVEYLAGEVPRAIEQTLDGVERVATIVRAMKEFAHPDGTEAAAVDLNHALLSTLTVARSELKYVADVETDLGDLPLIPCQPGTINQAFLNLLVNAAQAIEDRQRSEPGRGTIRVRTTRDADAAVVAISDNGCGIPEEVKPKIFD